MTVTRGDLIMAEIRIDRIIAASGLASRREAASLIRQGAVTANGATVRSGSEKFDPETADIRVSGEPVGYREHRYIMMNKPAGYVSAVTDRRDPPVTDLLDARLRRLELFPAGRLDKETEGFILLTNDGDLAHRVISPKSGVEKVYYAEVEGVLNDTDIQALAEGAKLRDGTRCLPARLEIITPGTAFVAVREGKYHQVRRMLASRGKPVKYLKRVSIGSVVLDGALRSGEYRELTEEELSGLFSEEIADLAVFQIPKKR